MEREGDLKTVSITQVVSMKSPLKMRYVDLHKEVETEVEL